MDLIQSRNKEYILILPAKVKMLIFEMHWSELEIITWNWDISRTIKHNSRFSILYIPYFNAERVLCNKSWDVKGQEKYAKKSVIKAKGYFIDVY